MPINQATKGKAKAAPNLEPEKLIPVMSPLSFKGIQEKMARDMPGNAPASPAPKKKRISKSDTKFQAAPVKAVSADQKVTIPAKAFLGPKVSAIRPPGTWNKA